METTLGIDLASQPRNTALCVVAWRSDRAGIVALARGGRGVEEPTDELLVASACGTRAIGGGGGDAGGPAEGAIDAALGGGGGRPARVAVDAPFGWPEPFARAVAAHGRMKPWPAGPGEERWPFERRE